MPIPDSIRDAPELRLGLQLFLNGFMDLTGSRPSGFGISPIPWHMITDYCDRLGLSGDQTEDMIRHVQALDTVYIEKKTKKDKPSG